MAHTEGRDADHKLSLAVPYSAGLDRALQHERRAVVAQPLAVLAVAGPAALDSAQKRGEWLRISRWQTSCQTT